MKISYTESVRSVRPVFCIKEEPQASQDDVWKAWPVLELIFLPP